MLKVGEVNTVSLVILNKYRKDGVGLHSFIDNKDGYQYLYTQFEADFCHFVFPCFDQPDIKATFTLRAQVPTEWVVISNEATIEDAHQTSELDDSISQAASLFPEQAHLKIEGAKNFIFSESFKISTYLYAICAGPYKYHERQSEGLPAMRIYARQTLIDDVHH